MSTDPATTSARFRIVLLFAVVLAACTFFVGNIGVFNDDYFCNQRDPVTGEAHDLIMNRDWHLWRPLTRRVLTPLITLLWPHPWILHAIDALLHAAITASVYTLIRRFGVRAGIAGPCALAFMVYPGNFEAVLWIAITCTLLSMLIVVGIWHIYLWWLTRSYAARVPLRLAALASMGGLSWCAAAFNEQPPAALAVLPLAALAIGPAAGSSRRHRLTRTAIPVLVIGCGLLYYIWGFARHTPNFKGLRVAEVGIWGRIWTLVEQVPAGLTMPQFCDGAWKHGLEVIAAHPARAAAFLCVMLLLGVGWAVREPSVRQSNDSGKAFRHMGVAILGFAWAAVVWLPVAPAHSHPYFRLYYASTIGIAILLAAVASMVADRLERFRVSTVRTILTTARLSFGALVVGAIVMWIGIQDAFQRRFRIDAAEVEPLVRTFGQSVEPGCVFMPVWIDSLTLNTGSYLFDRYFAQCWLWGLASGWRLQLAFQSRDVHTYRTGFGVAPEGLFVNPADPTHSVVCAALLAAPKPANVNAIFPGVSSLKGRQIPWDKLVLFDVEGAGNTLIYTRVRVHTATGEVFDLVPRQVSLSPEALKLPERVLEVFPSPRPPNRTGHQ